MDSEFMCSNLCIVGQLKIECECGKLTICGSPKEPIDRWGVTAFRKVSFVDRSASYHTFYLPGHRWGYLVLANPIWTLGIIINSWIPLCEGLAIGLLPLWSPQLPRIGCLQCVVFEFEFELFPIINLPWVLSVLDLPHSSSKVHQKQSTQHIPPF